MGGRARRARHRVCRGVRDAIRLRPGVGVFAGWARPEPASVEARLMGGIFGGGSEQRRARQQAERSEARARRQTQTSTEEAAREQQRGERTAGTRRGRGDVLRGRLGQGRPEAPAGATQREGNGGSRSPFEDILTGRQMVNPPDRETAGRARRQQVGAATGMGTGGGGAAGAPQQQRRQRAGIMDGRLGG